MERRSERDKHLKIFFVTGNKNKFMELEAMLPITGLEQLKINLPEIQEVDLERVVKAKLLEALKRCEGGVIVEDTGLYLECLNGLPGPFIKWFEERMGLDGIADTCDRLGEDGAIARTIIGYAKNRDEMFFFEGMVKGRIVKPRKSNGFGWDSIFMPESYNKTFSEMERVEKNRVSMRRRALEKLKEFLESPEQNH